MADVAIPIKGYHEDYLRPGMQVWLRLQQVNDRGKLVETLFGSSGDLTYQGYTTVANATYLIFDRVFGVGKKSQTEQFAINASHCPHIGPHGE